MDTKTRFQSSLDPVTFEVLRNAFVTIVDQMSEQVRRTCYSFVVYNRDFSNALCDADGNTVAQGTQDLAAHVGTLHYTCKAVIAAFAGDIHPGDVFLVNDPYVGGTHFSDTRVLTPIFHDGELIAWAQSNGHWADMGGSVPGSFDVTARDMFKEGIRIPPVKIWRRGEHCADVAGLVASNTRDPAAILGDNAAFAGIVAGMKTFFADIPLNSGLYRAVTVTVPDDTVVSARWPVAVSGMVMPFEKIMNALFELFSALMPERAMACAFNIEYLQTGGYDTRSPARPYFMFYDWLSGGWGGRRGRDGLGVTASPFGAGLMTQPVEGQERLCPARVDRMEIVTDSGGPGASRGGIALEKASTVLATAGAVISYICDRERDVLDCVRHYGVLCNWGTGELLARSTAQFREMLARRGAAYWAG